MQLSTAGIHPGFAQEKRPSKRAVSISRKDTIIIAMLVNIALLAILFATASRQSQPQLQTTQRPQAVVASLDFSLPEAAKPLVVASKAPLDEIDEILKSYALKSEQAIPAPVVTQTAIAQPVKNFFEVAVQKGDVLSKIAKQHNVKVEEIVLLNGLDSAKLKIGQIVKIPTTNSAKPTQVAPPTDIPAEFYVVQSGDSPWKIAKKCHIKTEDLLRLNNLDEEKARNLKIGQKLRIR